MQTPVAHRASSDNPVNGSNPATSWRQAASIFVLLAIVSLAVYAPVLDSYFVADDFGYVQLYLRGRLADVPRLLIADWSQGMWGINLGELRPVIAVSYMWDALLWGANPLGYHLTNLLAHTVNSLLVFLTLRALLKIATTPSVLAAVLFAVHPAHSEAVSWVAGRTELISSSFYLSGFLFFALYRSGGRRWHYLFSLALFAVGLFAKEMVMSLPLMLVAYDAVCRRARGDARRVKWWLPHVGYAAVTALYLCLRRLAFGGALRGSDFRELLARQGEYLNHLFPPLNVLGEGVGRKWLFALWLLIFLAVGLLLLLRGAARRWTREGISGGERALLFFGVAWYALSILPLAATYMSPRHLYLPSFGLCVALGLLLSRAEGALRAAMTVVLAAFIVFCTAQLFYKGWQWRQAAQLSEQMRDDLQQFVRDVPDGSGLIFVNTPGFERGLFVWAWATPFVLREPFSDSDLTRRYRVFDAPSSYCCQWAQDKVPALRDLMAHPVDSYLIYLDENRRLNKRHLPRDEVRTLLGRFLAPDRRGVTKDGNFEDAGLLATDWEPFWRAHLKL